tara:strand:- start:738 stop:935 length:198 start_codon:yes stop_codon:yes gene_type:complete
MNKFYTLEILKNFKRIIELMQKFGYQQINNNGEAMDFVLIDRELINLVKDIDDLEELIYQEIQQN